MGGIKLNFANFEVHANGHPVKLTPKEIQLLALLMKRPGRVLSRTQLFESVWGYEHVGTTRTVDVHLEQLRRKLGAAGQQIITLKGLGYKFAPEEPGEA